MESAASLAATIASNDGTAHSVIRSIIGGITLSRTGASIALSDDGLRISLGISGTATSNDDSALPTSQNKRTKATERSSAADLPDIMITSNLLRCGKQVKLVLGPDNGKQPEPDPK